MTLSRRHVVTGALAAALPFGAGVAVVGPGEAVAGLDLEAVDPTIRAGEDFYRYVNGRWLARAEIPDQLPLWGETSKLVASTVERVRAILERAARAPRSSNEAKLGALYSSLMDEPAIERLGVDPIRAALDRFEAAASPADLAAALAALSCTVPRDWQERAAPAAPTPICPAVMIDIRDPTRYRATLMQGGLGLPDRAYYMSDTADRSSLRDRYRHYLATLFRLSRRSEPEARASRVLSLEERLAASHRPRAELLDEGKRYHPWSRRDLERSAPGVDWTTYLKGVGFDRVSEYVIADPDAVIGAALAAREVPIEHWRDYLSACLLTSFAPLGPKDFVDAHFDFRDRALKGAVQPMQRWRRMSAYVDIAMGPAVSAVYMHEHLPRSARRVVEWMVVHIKAAMAERIAALQWMLPETKAEARRKLAAARVEVGGERPPRDFGDLALDRSQAWRNVSGAAEFEYRRNLSRLTRPVDRGEWGLLAHQPNGQANQPLVKLMITASLIQPPFYTPGVDAAVNFGGLGYTIAHELSHLFDDLGSQYDARGVLRNWWQDSDRTRFARATDALVAQYGSYEVLPGLPADARQTLSENVADLAGLQLAYHGYRRSLSGAEPKPISGLTGDQRFFMAFAQVWRTKLRDAYARQMTAVDSHSVPALRVATVRNVDAWYVAFGVGDGDRMYLPPDRRVRIW